LKVKNLDRLSLIGSKEWINIIMKRIRNDNSNNNNCINLFYSNSLFWNKRS